MRSVLSTDSLCCEPSRQAIFCAALQALTVNWPALMVVSVELPMVDSAETLEDLLKRVADKPVLLAHLAQLLATKGQVERAHSLCAQAIAMAPGDGEVRALTAEVLSDTIGAWYFPMVHDHPRNAAYEMALRRVVKPDSCVLEIGTGTGLLAMIAARSGAAEVVTCESNPFVADAAREIIARNG